MNRFRCHISLALVLVSLMALLLGVGCREGQTPEKPQGEQESPGPGGPQGPSPERSQATLRLFQLGPVTMDPALSGDSRSHIYITHIFSGLVAMDEDLKPVPDIASRWDISSDGKTYTFHLKKGVKFHNGREVKAGDFKYSWERAADPALQSQTAGTYLGDIVGVKEKLAGQAKEVRGVRVVDDYTIEVTIDAPKAYFLAKLSYPTAFVVDKENAGKGADWWSQPNGTGPFKVARWKEGDESLTMERNDAYYGRVPVVSRVVFMHRGGIPMRLYETGDIDAVNLDLNFLEQVKDPSNPLSKEVQVSPELSLFYIGFNITRPPFDDVKVRQAFAQAVDKEKIVTLILKGTSEKANGVLPTGMPGFNKDLKGLSYDVIRAKQLLTESKYGVTGKLPPIIFTTGGYGGAVSGLIGALIQDWQKNLGVEIEVRQLEPDFYLYGLKKEKNELFDFGWVADYPDPQDFLDILLSTGSEYNTGEYSNREVDQLLIRAGTERDTEQRFVLYRQAEEKVVQEAAIIPLYFGRNYFLVKPYVQGLTLSPTGIPSLTRAVVKPH
ncbi:MAG: oligopeptide transport system substrate-binding protein [Dehalococcoidia bacterium]|nr:oligopeptide transport system substrate-binding protein [Dehalococcoidia bacterium]